MAFTIQKRVCFSAVVIMVAFVLTSFLSVVYCVRILYENFRKEIANSVISFASLTINPDDAKDYLTLRTTDEAYISVLQSLKKYQSENATTVKRISLVSFTSTTGNYIYFIGRLHESQSYQRKWRTLYWV